MADSVIPQDVWVAYRVLLQERLTASVSNQVARRAMGRSVFRENTAIIASYAHEALVMPREDVYLLAPSGDVPGFVCQPTTLEDFLKGPIDMLIDLQSLQHQCRSLLDFYNSDGYQYKQIDRIWRRSMLVEVLLRDANGLWRVSIYG